MKKFIYTALASAPALAFAQAANLSGIQSLVSQIGNTIGKIIPIMFALAIIYFFWGLVKYIRSAGDNPKGAAEGRNIMIYGLIAIAIMASLYGLIAWLQSTLGVPTSGSVILPTVPGLGN